MLFLTGVLACATIDPRSYVTSQITSVGGGADAGEFYVVVTSEQYDEMIAAGESGAPRSLGFARTATASRVLRCRSAADGQPLCVDVLSMGEAAGFLGNRPVAEGAPTSCDDWRAQREKWLQMGWPESEFPAAPPGCADVLDGGKEEHAGE